ncbi:hypothetical protein ABZ590_09330 [Streptomyces hirsutus]
MNFANGAGVALGGVAFVKDAGLDPCFACFARPARCRTALETQVRDS